MHVESLTTEENQSGGALAINILWDAVINFCEAESRTFLRTGYICNTFTPQIKG